MSRGATRLALCRYLSGMQNPDPGDAHAWRGTAITNLGVIYDAPPTEWPHEWAIPVDALPGAPSGAMATPRIAHSLETRMTTPRVEGIKRVAYDVVIDVFFTSTRSNTGDAVLDLEDLIDSFTARLRADPTLGGAVFSAGEGDVGSRGGHGSRIEWDQGFPAFEAGVHTIYAACKFGVVEHVRA